MGCLVTLVLVLTGCGGPPGTRPVPPAAAAPAPWSVAAAEATYPVAVRVLRLRRGPGRPLPTHVFYPAAAAHSERPATGRFPLVLFSHGLSGSPERYAATLATWAAAGFVVAAPRYPYTNEFAVPFRRADIVHQPADARFVIDRVRRLGSTRGDPLWHRIDGRNVSGGRAFGRRIHHLRAVHGGARRAAAGRGDHGGLAGAGRVRRVHRPGCCSCRASPTRSCRWRRAGGSTRGCRGRRRTCCCGTTRPRPIAARRPRLPADERRGDRLPAVDPVRRRGRPVVCCPAAVDPPLRLAAEFARRQWVGCIGVR